MNSSSFFENHHAMLAMLQRISDQAVMLDESTAVLDTATVHEAGAIADRTVKSRTIPPLADANNTIWRIFQDPLVPREIVIAFAPEKDPAHFAEKYGLTHMGTMTRPDKRASLEEQLRLSQREASELRGEIRKLRSQADLDKTQRDGLNKKFQEQAKWIQGLDVKNAQLLAEINNLQSTLRIERAAHSAISSRVSALTAELGTVKARLDSVYAERNMLLLVQEKAKAGLNGAT